MARFGSTVLTLAMVCAVQAAAFAQGPVVSGGRDVFTVSDCTAPIALRFVSESKPAAIRSGDIAPRPAASPPGWTIDWEKPAASDAAINEYASAGHIKDGCPAPGLYTVPLTVYGEDHAAARFSLTVVRVAEPVLDVPASLSLTAEFVWGAPAAVPFLLRETIAGAADTRVSVLGGELRTTAGDATGIALEATNGPVVVRAGESARVMLAPTQTPAPGAYTTKLVLNGAAVKPGTTIDITYKVRAASYYLLGVIAIVIALGLVVNVFLTARAALEAALQAGLRTAQSLSRRASPQRDPAVQQRLLAVANLLQSNIEESTTSQEIGVRIGEAEAQAKEIENKAVEAASTLQQALAATRTLFRAEGQNLDGALAQRLAEPLRDLDELQRAADNGDVELTAARLQDFNRDLPTKVLPAVQGFLADARTELQALGPLPSDLAGTRDSLRQCIEGVYEAQDLGVMIKAADEVARRVRAWMDLVAPETLAALWRRAATVLGAGSALAPRLNAAADQAEQLRRTARDPLDRLGTLGDNGKAVVAAITAAAPDDAGVAEVLARGDIVAAAHILAGGPASDPAQLEIQDAVATVPPVSGRALVLATAGPVAVLRIKPLLPLEQDSMVVLRWMGAPPAPERVTWQCHPQMAATVQPGPAGATVRPTQAGFLTIFLEVDKLRVAEARSYAGEVAKQAAYVTAARQGRLAGTAITATTALLTAFAGYQIFAPTWFGTVGDFFAAFLWGFFGQFGLDRIRDFAKPLLSRSLPS